MEEIAGKTIGLIGFGHIGQSVARIALAFGMLVPSGAASGGGRRTLCDA
ncbi:MAG: NAD(P)-dependent oxidoreductase [Christensenellales bacterium]